MYVYVYVCLYVWKHQMYAPCSLLFFLSISLSHHLTSLQLDSLFWLRKSCDACIRILNDLINVQHKWNASIAGARVRASCVCCITLCCAVLCSFFLWLHACNLKLWAAPICSIGQRTWSACLLQNGSKNYYNRKTWHFPTFTPLFTSFVSFRRNFSNYSPVCTLHINAQ